MEIKTTIQKPEVLFCKTCGTKLNEAEVYCKKCGTLIARFGNDVDLKEIEVE